MQRELCGAVEAAAPQFEDFPASSLDAGFLCVLHHAGACVLGLQVRGQFDLRGMPFVLL